MEPVARRKLAEFLRSEGTSLADDPQRVRALLLDACPDAKTEISLLTLAVEDEIPVHLLRSSSDAVMREAAIARTIADLQTTRRLDRGAAEWVVSSWAWALSLSSIEPQDNVGKRPDSTESDITMPETGHAPIPGGAGSGGSVGGDVSSDGSGMGVAPDGPAWPVPGTSSQPGYEGMTGPSPESALGNASTPDSPGSYPPGSYPPGSYPPGSYPPGPYPPGQQTATFQAGTNPAQQGSAYPPNRKPSHTPLLIGGAIVSMLLLLLVVGGVSWIALTTDPTPKPHPTLPTSTASPTSQTPTTEEARVTITDSLVSGEASERVTVFLEGRNFGELSIDGSRRDAKLSFTIPVGNYNYQLTASITYVDTYGNARNFHITGRGTIYVTDGVTFAVSTIGSGENMEFALREVS